MPDFTAVVKVTQKSTLTVTVEADSQEEALELIQRGEFDDVIDETDTKIVSINEVEFTS